MKKHEPLWCNWPNRKYARDVEDLTRMAIRCDAWREFFSSETAAAFRRMKGNILWFNRYEYFDKLLCEFGASERQVTATIQGLMRPGHEKPVVFTRNDIYDARAWSHLPLDCFIDVQGMKPRTEDPRWPAEILSLNEMPSLGVSVRKPWVVSAACFSMRSRRKDGRRIAVMTFAHPQLDDRFNNKRWVAEEEFPVGTNSAEMRTRLLGTVRDKCKKCLVTIEEQ